ncbi:MAG: hydroxyacid-oxoacid transhydrogenase [Pseudomonadota bacterium]
MGCCQHYAPIQGGEEAFTVAMPMVTFGRGALGEVGERARARGLRRVALFTDKRLTAMAPVAHARQSLKAAGVDAAVYDDVKVEPGKDSVMEAARFVQDGRFDGFVSVGGGSVMDSCKAASMYGTYPADALDYVPPPNGAGKPLPGPLKPHLACPTTAGTGSEVTPLSVIDFPEINTKIPLLSRHIMPSEAIVDPTCTYSLPERVVAASAFDLLSHALEAFTARPFSRYPKAESAGKRIPIQGANPWSDMCAREALQLAGSFLVRSVTDADDHEARDQMAWAATLAGIGFGNTGTHAPHAMGYPVAALDKGFGVEGYPSKPMIPHGFTVIVNAPSLFRFTAQATPERHLEAAVELGADARGAASEDAGEVVTGRLIELMKATAMPNGIGGLGYGEDDVGELATLCKRQRRALGNAPRDIDLEGDDLNRLFAGALSYW